MDLVLLESGVMEGGSLQNDIGGEHFQKLQNDPPKVKHERILKKTYFVKYIVLRLQINSQILALFPCLCLYFIELYPYKITFLSQNRSQNSGSIP